ncbi:MAG: DUF819 domain-containing protein [Dysosmobacter sp.]
MITTGFYYIAACVAIPAIICWLEAKTSWKVWKWLPAFVFVYLVNMICCTVHLWDLEATYPAYAAVKNNLLYAMIPLMLIRCDVRKLAKLGPKLILTFLCSVLTVCVGVVVSYAIFHGALGNNSAHAAAALVGSWLGGSDNMVAVQAVLNVPEGDMGACIIIDNIYYSVWIAFLLWSAAMAAKFNKFTKADTSYLDNKIDMNAEELMAKAEPANFTGLMFLLGFGLACSALTQWIGSLMSGFLTLEGGTWTVILGTLIGVFAGMSPISRIGGKEELSNMLVYIVVSLLASRAGFNELFDAPIWLVFGAVALALHAALFILLAKIFHFDLFSCATASMACIGGTGSAPIVAASFNSMLIPVGILMGIFGGLLGNFLALICDGIMIMF